jgi:hypothetical protein
MIAGNDSASVVIDSRRSAARNLPALSAPMLSSAERVITAPRRE